MADFDEEYIDDDLADDWETLAQDDVQKEQAEQKAAEEAQRIAEEKAARKAARQQRIKDEEDDNIPSFSAEAQAAAGDMQARADAAEAADDLFGGGERQKRVSLASKKPANAEEAADFGKQVAIQMKAHASGTAFPQAVQIVLKTACENLSHTQLVELHRRLQVAQQSQKKNLAAIKASRDKKGAPVVRGAAGQDTSAFGDDVQDRGGAATSDNPDFM